MKFAISAVVMLALAMGAQSSLLGGLHGLVSPLGYAATIAHPGPLLAQGPALVAPAPALPLLPSVHGLPAAVNVVASPVHVPAAVAVAPHAAVAAAIPAIPAHGATYVAKTRGAVHTAPLAGHINSAASINLAPAPGTW